MNDAQKAAMTPLEILRSNKRWFTDVRDYYILYDALSTVVALREALLVARNVLAGDERWVAVKVIDRALTETGK